MKLNKEQKETLNKMYEYTFSANNGHCKNAYEQTVAALLSINEGIKYLVKHTK